MIDRRVRERALRVPLRLVDAVVPDDLVARAVGLGLAPDRVRAGRRIVARRVRDASGIAGAVVRTGGCPFRRPSSQVNASGFCETPLQVFETCPSSVWTPHCESRFADHIETRARCILRANETSALASLDAERLARHVVPADHRRRAHALVDLARRQRDARAAVERHELEVRRLERVADARAHRLARGQRAAEVHRHHVDAVDRDAAGCSISVTSAVASARQAGRRDRQRQPDAQTLRRGRARLQRLHRDRPAQVGGRVRERGALDVEIDDLRRVALDDARVGGVQRRLAGARDGEIGVGRAAERDDGVAAPLAQPHDPPVEVERASRAVHVVVRAPGRACRGSSDRRPRSRASA